MPLNVKNVKFNIIDSPNPRYVEVVVTFLLDGINKHHYIFVTRHDDFTSKDYLNEAEKIFINDVKNNRLKQKRMKTTSPALIIVALFFTVSAAIGGFLTYRMLPRSEENPEVGDITINFDSETMDDMSIYPTSAKKDKDYEGVVTLKNDGYVISLKSVAVTINDKKLVDGTDYTFAFKGLSTENKYEYNLKILAACMIGNITISAQLDDISKYQVTNDVLKDVFKDISKLKTVNAGSENYVLADYIHCLDGINYYSPAVQRKISIYTNEANCETYDEYSVLDGSEYVTSYTNDGAGKFYKKAQTSSTSLQPTGSFDACYTLTNEILPSRKLKIGDGENDLHFDPSTLTYTCASQTIEFVDRIITIDNLSTSFYDNKIVKANIEATKIYVDYRCEINARTEYYYDDIGDISAPSDDISYLEDTPYCDDKNVWVPLLNDLKKSTEMYYVHQITTPTSDDSLYKSFDENKIRFRYNGSPYSYIEKTNDNKYYLYEKLNEKWSKKEITSQEYDIYSNKRLIEFIDIILEHINGFWPYGTEYAFEIGSKLYCIHFCVHNSISGTNSEAIIDRISCTDFDLINPSAEIFHYIKSSCNFNIRLPEVS